MSPGAEDPNAGLKRRMAVESRLEGLAAGEDAEAKGPQARRPAWSDKTRIRYALLAIIVSTLVLAWNFCPRPTRTVTPPVGFQLMDLKEVDTPQGPVVEGTAKNGTTTPIGTAQFALVYVNDRDFPVANVIVTLKNIKAGEERRFSQRLPKWDAGLKRTVTPVRLDQT